MPREKRGRRVTGAGLVRRPVIDVHQLGGHKVEIDVRALQPVADATARGERVEHGRAQERRIDHESCDVPPGVCGSVPPYETGGLDQHERRILSRVAGTENRGVGGGQQ